MTMGDADTHVTRFQHTRRRIVAAARQVVAKRATQASVQAIAGRH
jgi:hypothetical protein